MILSTIVSVLIILGALSLWIGVQHGARVFAARHPEFGPAREEGGGCGFFCLCKGSDECPRRALVERISDVGKPAHRTPSDSPDEPEPDPVIRPFTTTDSTLEETRT